MDRLSYKKARMLRYWSERAISHIVKPYEVEYYGRGLIESANEFLNMGLLRISLPSENVEKTTIPELKQFLKSVGGKQTGNKTELCQRIIYDYSDEQLASFFNKSFYILTDLGNQQLSLNSVFFLNDKYYCGLTESEINIATNSSFELPDYKILISILNSKLPTDIKQNEFDNYNRHLRSLFRICADYEEYEEAVLYLWLYLYNELSGIQNPWYGESLPRVNEIQYIHIGTESIKLLDECIIALKWDNDDFKEYVRKHCAKITPDYVFHYYSVEDVLSIISEQLMGINYSAFTCQLQHNTPKTDSKNYVYYASNPAISEAEEIIEEETNTIDEKAFIKKCITSTGQQLLQFLRRIGITPNVDSVEIYSNCFELKLKFEIETDIQLVQNQIADIAELLGSPMIWTKNHSSLVASIFVVHPNSYFKELKETEYFKKINWYSLSI